MCDRLSSDRQMTRTRELWSSGCCNKDAWDPFPSNHYGSGRDKNLQKTEDWSPLERRNFNPHPQCFRYDALALSSLIRISNNSLNRFALSVMGFPSLRLLQIKREWKYFERKTQILSWVERLYRLLLQLYLKGLRYFLLEWCNEMNQRNVQCVKFSRMALANDQTFGAEWFSKKLTPAPMKNWRRNATTPKFQEPGSFNSSAILPPNYDKQFSILNAQISRNNYVIISNCWLTLSLKNEPKTSPKKNHAKHNIRTINIKVIRMHFITFGNHKSSKKVDERTFFRFHFKNYAWRSVSFRSGSCLDPMNPI